jgi:predicted small lipoprotein YifL
MKKNKIRKNILVLVALVLVSMAFTACGSKEPEIDINAQKTGFAQTAEVQATMTAQAQPTLTPTPEITLTSTPTETPTGGTPTATQSATPTGATATVATGGADAAAWRANDPPDNTVFAPGEEFTVTWTIENTGTSTWSTGYFIKFYSGSQMHAPDEVYLPYAVPPGTNVQISVDFTAPDTEGTKRSDWILKNANDETFYSFYIVVEVGEASETTTEAPTVTPTVTATP